MGFSNEIKEKMMIASARHCCACNRYTGVKIEVHHIIPKEQGGADTEDNAIPLCFDCHADAGHYNPKHPRGTKYSSEELRKSKDIWFENVKNNNIVAPDLNDELLVRHYLCSDWDSIVDISNNDFTSLPIASGLMVNNQVLTFLKDIIKQQKDKTRIVNYSLQKFSTFNEVKLTYPNIHPSDIPSKEELSFYAFECQRPATVDELIQTNDYIGQLLLKEMPLEDFSRVEYHTNGCSGIECEITETLCLKKISLLLLSIENASNHNIQLKSYRAITNLETNELTSYQLPNILIKPNDRVIILQSLLLEPFEEI